MFLQRKYEKIHTKIAENEAHIWRSGKKEKRRTYKQMWGYGILGHAWLFYLNRLETWGKFGFNFFVDHLISINCIVMTVNWICAQFVSPELLFSCSFTPFIAMNQSSMAALTTICSLITFGGKVTNQERGRVETTILWKTGPLKRNTLRKGLVFSVSCRLIMVCFLETVSEPKIVTKTATLETSEMECKQYINFVFLDGTFLCMVRFVVIIVVSVVIAFFFILYLFWLPALLLLWLFCLYLSCVTWYKYVDAMHKCVCILSHRPSRPSVCLCSEAQTRNIKHILTRVK